MLFIIGCSSSSNLYLSNCRDNINASGKKYFVNNLEKGTYEIEFIASEFEYGTLKEEHILYKTTVNRKSKNTTFKVGVMDGNEINSHYLKAIIDDTESLGYNFDLLKEGFNSGISLSILNKNKSFNLDDKVAIAVYSIGRENSPPKTLNIDETFEIDDTNLTDLVVYIKIHKTS